MGPTWGCIEYVENCVALRDARLYNDVFSDEQLRKLVATAAGRFVGHSVPVFQVV